MIYPHPRDRRVTIVDSPRQSFINAASEVHRSENKAALLKSNSKDRKSFATKVRQALAVGYNKPGPWRLRLSAYVNSGGHVDINVPTTAASLLPVFQDLASMYCAITGIQHVRLVAIENFNSNSHNHDFSVLNRSFRSGTGWRDQEEQLLFADEADYLFMSRRFDHLSTNAAGRACILARPDYATV